MRKRNIISVLILSLIMNSLIIGVYFLQNSTEQENVNEDSLPDLVYDFDSKTTTIPSIDSPDGWSERETVKSDIEFNIQMMDFDYITAYESDHSRTFGVYEKNREYSVGNDGYYHWILIDYDTPNNMPILYIYGHIYCGGVGVLTYEQKLLVCDSSADDYSYTESGTLNVNSDFLDAQGYLHFEFFVSVIVATNDIIFKLYYLNVGSSWARNEVFRADEEVGSSFGSVYYLAILSDRFYFVRTTIESQIRSSYQYASDTVLIHKLTIPSVQHAKEINVYAPTHWTYSSINPTATVSTVGSDHTIESPTELTYEMLFTSESSYFLALEDTIINYISSTEANFEGGTMGGWFDYREYLGNSPMDTFEVSTDISFDGYHSLHIETSTDAYPTASLAFDQTSTVNLAEGFYLSFWYYWVTTDTFRFGVVTEDNSAWDAYTLPTTITDRWIRHCQYYEGTNIISNSKSVEFYGADSSSTMDLYIDNFEIFTVSAEIETTDLDEYKISSTFISWDGYDNPVLTNEEITFELWDRTAETETSSYETTTNSLGVASWIYESSLSQKEYMIKSYTYDNRFGDYATKELGDTWDFNEGDADGWGDFQSPTISNGFAHWETTATRIRNTFDDGDVDFSIYSNFIMRYRTNESDWFLKSTAGYDYSSGSNLISDENWHVENRTFIDSFLITQSMLSIRTANPSWIYVDYILIVEDSFFSEFYFTPSYPYNIDYASEVLSNEWDFSEGDDGYNSFAYANFGGVENGFHNTSHTTDSSDYFSIYSQDGLSIDTDYYTKAEIRIRLDNFESGASWRWYLVLYDPNYNMQGTTYALTESWQTFSINLDPSLTVNRIRLYVFEENDNYTTDVDFHTDFVRLVHIEESETYLTNTYLGLGSENDAWTSAVYSDNVFLGYYNDPYLVSLNQTIGTHNISWLPIARQNEQKAFLYNDLHTYTYSINEADNYFILLNAPSYDVSAGLLYLDIVTYWGNQTVRVFDNGTALGNAVPEGSSVWSFDNTKYGFHNFTVEIYNGASVWATLTSSITITEPAAPEGLIIEIWNKDVDVAAGLIYVNAITSWGNQSVRLQDNSTWLGDYASEGASIWLFPTTFGLHNISIWLYNGLTPMFVEYFSFTIQEPSLEIFTVHFDLFTIAGIGLPFETAKIYVNDSRIYNPQQYYFKDSFIEVKVRDYYNHLLFATNATITANRDIALYVRLFMQQIRNSYEIPVEVYFISTFDSNYNHSYIVAAEGSISVLLFSSSYHVLVKPLQDEYQNSTHIVYFYATTSEYQDLGDETKSYSITMETDLKPLDLEEPKGVRAWPAWVLLANSIIINAILISFIGAMGKWGIVKIWNYGLYYPNKGANWILRKFGSEKELHWCVEHKGGLEFVTPEQYDKAEALKEEGKF